MDIPETKENQPLTKDKNSSAIVRIIIILFIVISLPVLMILVNSGTGSHDIRSKASVANKPVSGKILYVPFSYQTDVSGEKTVKFDSSSLSMANIRNGFVPSNQVTGKNTYTAVLFDTKGNKTSSTNFSPPDLVAVDGIDSSTGRERAELMQVGGSNSALSMSYADNSAYLQIQDEKGNIVQNISLKNSSAINNLVNPVEVNTDDLKDQIENTKKQSEESYYRLQPTVTSSLQPTITLRPTIGENRGNSRNSDEKQSERSGFDKFMNLVPVKSIFAANGRFNIAIIGDNYGTNNVLFQSDVNSIVSALLSVEPFATNKANISIYPQLSTVSICTQVAGWPSISCDDTKALQQASSVPYDKVYVLYNGPYTGYAYVGGILSYGSNATDKASYVKQGLFIHEMAGHSLGGLMDEYSYGTTGISFAPNCSTDGSCISWSGITGLGCFNTCGYTNLYRATNNSSVMNTAFFQGLFNFDNYSTQIVNNKLYSYLQILSPAPTSTPIPANIPTGVGLLSLLSSPTAIPTIIPVLSPTLTLTSTPVPTTILTSTNMPIPSVAITPATGSSSTLDSTQLSNIKQMQTLNFVPSSTPLPTAINTPVPSVTQTFSVVIPSTNPTPIPSPTAVKSNCAFPNFCTLTKYCANAQIAGLTCADDAHVCCAPIEESKDSKTPDENNNQQEINHFIPLPTLPPRQIVNPEDLSFPIPIISPTVYISSAYISPTITVAIRQNLPTATIYIEPTTIPNNIRNTTPITEVISPKPTVTAIIPTPSIVNPDNLDLERETPTPAPKSSFMNNLGFFGSLIENIWNSIFSGGSDK